MSRHKDLNSDGPARFTLSSLNSIYSNEQNQNSGRKGMSRVSQTMGRTKTHPARVTSGVAPAPRPVNLPSLRRENAGLDPFISLVPSGGVGWQRKQDNSQTGPGSSKSTQENVAHTPPPPAAWGNIGVPNKPSTTKAEVTDENEPPSTGAGGGQTWAAELESQMDYSELPVFADLPGTADGSIYPTEAIDQPTMNDTESTVNVEKESQAQENSDISRPRQAWADVDTDHRSHLRASYSNEVTYSSNPLNDFDRSYKAQHHQNQSQNQGQNQDPTHRFGYGDVQIKHHHSPQQEGWTEPNDSRLSQGDSGRSRYPRPSERRLYQPNTDQHNHPSYHRQQHHNNESDMHRHNRPQRSFPNDNTTRHTKQEEHIAEVRHEKQPEHQKVEERYHEDENYTNSRPTSMHDRVEAARQRLKEEEKKMEESQRKAREKAEKLALDMEQEEQVARLEAQKLIEKPKVHEINPKAILKKEASPVTESSNTKVAALTLSNLKGAAGDSHPDWTEVEPIATTKAVKDIRDVKDVKDVRDIKDVKEVKDVKNVKDFRPRKPTLAESRKDQSNEVGHKRKKSNQSTTTYETYEGSTVPVVRLFLKVALKGLKFGRSSFKGSTMQHSFQQSPSSEELIVKINKLSKDLSQATNSAAPSPTPSPTPSKKLEVVSNVITDTVQQQERTVPTKMAPLNIPILEERPASSVNAVKESILLEEPVTAKKESAMSTKITPTEAQTPVVMLKWNEEEQDFYGVPLISLKLRDILLRDFTKTNQNERHRQNVAFAGLTWNSNSRKRKRADLTGVKSAYNPIPKNVDLPFTTSQPTSPVHGLVDRERILGASTDSVVMTSSSLPSSKAVISNSKVTFIPAIKRPSTALPSKSSQENTTYFRGDDSVNGSENAQRESLSSQESGNDKSTGGSYNTHYLYNWRDFSPNTRWDRLGEPDTTNKNGFKDQGPSGWWHPSQQQQQKQHSPQSEPSPQHPGSGVEPSITKQQQVSHLQNAFYAKYNSPLENHHSISHTSHRNHFASNTIPNNNPSSSFYAGSPLMLLNEKGADYRIANGGVAAWPLNDFSDSYDSQSSHSFAGNSYTIPAYPSPSSLTHPSKYHYNDPKSPARYISPIQPLQFMKETEGMPNSIMESRATQDVDRRNTSSVDASLPDLSMSSNVSDPMKLSYPHIPSMYYQMSDDFSPTLDSNFLGQDLTNAFNSFNVELDSPTSRPVEHKNAPYDPTQNHVGKETAPPRHINAKGNSVSSITHRYHHPNGLFDGIPNTSSTYQHFPTGPFPDYHMGSPASSLISVGKTDPHPNLDPVIHQNKG